MPSKSEKRIDWAAVRNEYITGTLSLKALASKYGTSTTNVARHSSAEGWTKLRAETVEKAQKRAQEQAISSAARNVETAARIKAKLLAKLERAIDNLPEDMKGTTAYADRASTDFDKKTGVPVKRKSGYEYKLRDLTAAYKDLTADMQPEAASGNELLQSLYDLARKGESSDD